MNTPIVRSHFPALFLTLAFGLPVAATLCLPVTLRASVAPGGLPANGASFASDVSSDGNRVVFHSVATNLAPSDVGGQQDVFLRDYAAGTTVRLSVGIGGGEANGSSQRPRISSDGRWVVFQSFASNIVPGDTNGAWDVFLVDTATGVIERASYTSFGGQANTHAFTPDLSDDGRYVSFHTAASNLIPGDTNGDPDVYVWDRLTFTAVRASVSGIGFQVSGASSAARLSADGRRVAFQSASDFLVLGDTNGSTDVFLRDLDTSTTYRISVLNDPLLGLVGGNAASSAPSISDDGTQVAFTSVATNLVPSLGFTDTNAAADVFVRKWVTGTTTLITRSSAGGLPVDTANGASSAPALSGDGSHVAFHSDASDLGPIDANGVRDVYVKNLMNGDVRIASLSTIAAVQSTSSSSFPSISGDGGYVSFESAWGLFDQNDTNGLSDVLRYRFDCTFPEVYCTAKTTSNGCRPLMYVAGAAQVSNYSLVVIGTDLINKKNGLLFYGISGKAALPFQGGTLCVQPPTKRTPIQSSGGSPTGTDCSGSFALNMGDFAHGLLGGNPLPQLLVPDTIVNCQWWGRDSGFAAPNNTMLSDALEFSVLP